MSLAKPTFALVLAFALSACAMEVASGDGPVHDPGTNQQVGNGDSKLSTKSLSHVEETAPPTAGTITPTGATTPPKPKGDPASAMDRPQPEPWDPTSTNPPSPTTSH